MPNHFSWLLFALLYRAEGLISYQNVAFRSSLAARSESPQPHSTIEIDFQNRKLLKINMDGKVAEDTQEGTAVPDTPTADSVALRILASTHDSQCNYELDKALVSDLLEVLGQYQLMLIKQKDGHSKKSKPNTRRTKVTFRKLMFDRSQRFVQAAPQTFYRYSQYQGSGFGNPFARRLNGVSKNYPRCVPTEAAFQETTSDASADLAKFKTDFHNLKDAYASLFAALDLQSPNSEAASLTPDRVAALVTMSTNIIKSHGSLEEMITELGEDCDKFKLNEAETLELFGLLVDYNHIKMATNCLSAEFSAKDERLGQICTSFLVTFNGIDSDLENLLRLNDQLEEASQDLANVDLEEENGSHHAAVAVPQVAQVARNIQATLQKISESLENTATLKKEAQDALADLTSVAELPADALEQATPHSAGRLTLSLLFLGLFLI